jgi:LDH2 family malate/lactate/ureidoglycolate dehydrogenase
VLLPRTAQELALWKVREYMTAGKPLRPGVLLDKDGNHTTDSSCLPPHHGALLPFGSTKS